MPLIPSNQPPYYTVGNGITRKKYKAYINQTGTADPLPNILENTIGTIIWTRTLLGEYTGTLTGAFPNAAKTICKPGGSGIQQDGAGVTLPFDHAYSLQRTTANTVILSVLKTSDYSGVELSAIFADNQVLVEIETYP